MPVLGGVVEPACAGVPAQLEVDRRLQCQGADQRRAGSLACIVEVDLLPEIAVDRKEIEEASRRGLEVDTGPESWQQRVTDQELFLVQLDPREATSKHRARRILVFVGIGEE